MTKALLHELGKSLSFGRLSLRAKVLWPMLLASSDDQGRGTAEPDAIKWYVCPNVPEIAIADVPGLLQEMVDQGMILIYECSRGPLAYQIIRWWEYQSLRWARPSKFPPPDGWVDRIRYSDRGNITEEHWDGSGGFQSDPTIDKPTVNRTENCIENSRDNQPNLTQLNLTKEKKGASAIPPDCFPELFDTSISEIKERNFTRPQWQSILRAEQDANGRKTLIEWIDAKLNGAQHPAIQVYHEIMGRYPKQSTYAAIIETVGNNGGLETWREVVRYWNLQNYNPQGIADMLDAFRQGGVKRKGGASGGSRQTHRPEYDQSYTRDPARAMAEANAAAREIDLDNWGEN